jgi:hypothetical protein
MLPNAVDAALRAPALLPALLDPNDNPLRSLKGAYAEEASVAPCLGAWRMMEAGRVGPPPLPPRRRAGGGARPAVT